MEDLVLANGGGQAALNIPAVFTRALLDVKPRDMSALYLLDNIRVAKV